MLHVLLSRWWCRPKWGTAEPFAHALNLHIRRRGGADRSREPVLLFYVSVPSEAGNR